MFRLEADAFCHVLDQKPLSETSARFFATILSREGRNRVLDLGCGAGRLTQLLSRQSSLVVGLDYSSELIEAASERCDEIDNAVFTVGDFRGLKEKFPAGHFQAVVRAYTSLGYFDYDTERSILEQSHVITSSDAVIIIDTFNSDWIQDCGELVRRSQFPQFNFDERYAWDSSNKTIVCEWSYSNKSDSIKFSLDGYNSSRIESILKSSGWEVVGLWADYDLSRPFDQTALHERIVAVAKKPRAQQDGAGQPPTCSESK